MKHNTGEMNEADQNLIQGITDILQGDDGLGELKQTVKDSLRDSMESLLAKWNQCDKMKKLDDYKALRKKIVKITALPKEQLAWFYIGYTNQNLDSFYLWDTKPKNQDFTQLVKDVNLIKKRTYYVRLNRTANENEHNLITAFCKDPRCLNRQDYGREHTVGIVYVLKYRPRDT